jgi:cardiolipin synthase
MIHAKTLTIDGVWSSVGSVNFDNRSFQLQDEVTLCVRSRRFAALLDEQFARDLERAEEIDGQRWNGRPLFDQVAEGLTKLARREL